MVFWIYRYLIMIGVFLVESGEKNHSTKSFNLFFNNHITMAPSNDESGLSEAPTTATTPFIIAARSVASFKPANHTRNKATRKGIMSPKQPTKRPNPPTQRSSNNHTSLVTISVRASEREYQEEESSEDSHAEILAQTPGPRSGISPASQSYMLSLVP